jgi:hypothetical protein
MTILAPSDPLDRLSRADRRRWRRLDRQAQATLDAQQLRRLRALADRRPIVESVSSVATGSPWMIVLGLSVRSWRLAGRAPARAGAELAAAVTSGSVWLAAAGRYGPYWTLTFGGRSAPVALLLAGLTVSRDDGGVGGILRGPVLRLVG